MHEDQYLVVGRELARLARLAVPTAAPELRKTAEAYRRVVERRYHGKATWADVADADAALLAALAAAPQDPA